MEKFKFFWRNQSPFSQWYIAYFQVEQIQFNCAEQYMMYQKAKLFGDEEIAKRIAEALAPAEHKKLGRQVKNFAQPDWENNCKKIVYDGNYAKFTQNPNLLQYLLDTEGTTLVEASPVDRIWGVGLSENDTRILNRSTWRGKNWLGEVLTQLREDLLKEKG